MAQKLAPEILSEIISYIGQDGQKRVDTLRNLALASRALRPQAQAAIFRTLDIDDPRILDAIASSISGSPVLGSYVRNLRLSFSFHRSGDWPEGLSQISAHLTALRDVRIEGMSWAELGANARRAILQALSPVSSLVLRSCEFPHARSVLDIALACRNLESLSVLSHARRAVEVEPSRTTSLYPITPSFSSLKHIELGTDLRLATVVSDALLESTMFNLTSVTIRLWSIKEGDLTSMTLHRLFARLTLRTTYLHVSKRACDVCASGDSTPPWPSDDRFLTMLVPNATIGNEDKRDTATELETWFGDVLSIVYTRGVLRMMLNFDERDAPSDSWDALRRLLIHPRLSSLTTVHLDVGWAPPEDESSASRSDEGGQMEARMRRDLVDRLSGLNANPTYHVNACPPMEGIWYRPLWPDELEGH
ncbi:hypothetical protein PUNSTDRAFT_144958 [Punctularia strigosozonata HHB-11173 SS5]|uniref:uncharacterized protein n=1 Tax=Punctularia strigosozonata (strain HHB-11173) TaxID=741275 RepID=UPI0004417D5C|nr:uncharacterized protein PUNSTDRAFT_144958 [Punctularia strigosozonata HHB-11173 SS5]EIN07489.1 hypothetical protein PUNSTDRAFT_144958 [Punctularia strigosozonata HHB-11173 SS5]